MQKRIREQIVSDGIEKSMKMIDIIKSKKSKENIKRKVRISSCLTLEINGFVKVEEDEILKEEKSVFGFEVYAICNGEDVDCMTIDGNRDIREDIAFLINCYA